MKNILAVSSLFLFALCAEVMADPTIAKSSGTTYTIIVTTTPSMALSTGTNVQYDNYGANTYSYYGSTTVVPGQVMRNRIQIEFFNDTSTDVFVGYNQDVSAYENINRGRRIPSGQSWAHECSIVPHWVVSSTTTRQKFTITQEGNLP